MMLFRKLTNRMFSFQIEAKPIHKSEHGLYIKQKKLLLIHFAEETIHGSHITITTAKLRLCTNYTPAMCNLLQSTW